MKQSPRLKGKVEWGSSHAKTKARGLATSSRSSAKGWGHVRIAAQGPLDSIITPTFPTDSPPLGSGGWIETSESERQGESAPVCSLAGGAEGERRVKWTPRQMLTLARGAHQQLRG